MKVEVSSKSRNSNLNIVGWLSEGIKVGKCEMKENLGDCDVLCHSVTFDALHEYKKPLALLITCLFY